MVIDVFVGLKVPNFQNMIFHAELRLSLNVKISCPFVIYLLLDRRKSEECLQQQNLSHPMTKQSMWLLHTAKTQIGLGVRPVCSEH